ncbi:MAG: cyanophycinase [Gemmatimonadota bacterium]|nr:cyanophycinase [Gemmatimonadota bacterium]
MRRAFRLLLPVLLLVSPLAAQVVGPARGSLVIMGGGPGGRDVLEKFIELAGGPDAPIVVIPTAGGNPTYDASGPEVDRLRQLGATNLILLHTYDRAEASDPAFAAPIRKARGVWFPGGRQWRLADSYLDTPVLTELQALLDRGGVIGGTSAGATILGSYLARGDTRDNFTMMGDHEIGFGFVKNTAIDQHLLRRNRQHDLIGVLEKLPHLLGIGLDENTAIVVRGDTAEVIGQSYMMVYDNQRTLGDGGRFYMLQPGDKLNLNTREPSRTIEGLRREPWKATTMVASNTPVSTAAGTFDVTVTPQAPDAHTPGSLGRFTLDKIFHGELNGTSVGQMLAAGTPTDGSAGYVAIEQVTGTLQGRRGSFVLQHSGTMNRGEASLVLTVVPDSGTEGLAGLAGSMTITVADGVHSYAMNYQLPVRP